MGKSAYCLTVSRAQSWIKTAREQFFAHCQRKNRRMESKRVKYAIVIRYYVHTSGMNAAGLIVNDGVLKTITKWDRPVPKFTVKELNTPAVKKVAMRKLNLNGDVRFISAVEYYVRWFYNHFFTDGFSLMWEMHDE